MNKNQKGFSFVEIMLVLIFVTLLGFAGWYVWDKDRINKGSLYPNSQEQSGSTSKYKLFSHNEKFNLSFDYPSNWKVTDESAIGESWSVDLNSPDFTEEGDAYPETKTGAEFTISYSPIANATTIDEALRDQGGPFIDLKVAGEDARQYTHRYEGPELLVTSFLHDGYQFSLIYRYPVDQTDKKYLDQYNRLVESFRLN